MALASHNHMPSVCIEHEKKTHEHDFMAQAFMANLHWSETLCASSVSAENDYYSPHKKEQHSSRPNHAISTDELQGLYPRVIKRGKLGNPRTKKGDFSEKIIELSGFPASHVWWVWINLRKDEMKFGWSIWDYYCIYDRDDFGTKFGIIGR